MEGAQSQFAMDPSSIPPHPPSTFPPPISLFPINYDAVAAPTTTTTTIAAALVVKSAPAAATFDAVSTRPAAPIANHPPNSEINYAAIEVLKEWI